MSENLVKDVGLLQVVELFFAANKCGDRKSLARQQLEEGLKGDQRRHALDLPPRCSAEYAVNLAELRNTVVGQSELLDPIQVLLTRTALDDFELPGDEGVPGAVLSVGVINESGGIRLAGDVLRTHGALLMVFSYMEQSDVGR